MAAGGYDGSITINSSIDSRGFNTGIRAMIGSLKGLAAAVGLAFSIAAVIAFGKSSVDAAAQLAAAMTGLQSVVQGTGHSFAEAKQFINGYISDGLVPATNAVTAYKNLLLRGYDTSQIENVMTALKDSAAFGRQGSLSIGEAIQGATEGLKNENSILVDNAGVTKNVSVMWKEFAASIGTTADKLTKQQKIQAEVKGILEETKFQTGDAAKLAGQYSGQVAALTASMTNLRVAVGNSIIPAISKIMPYIKAAVDQLTIYFNRLSDILSLLLNVDIGKGVAGLADDAQAAADAQNNLADATEAASKAAKGALASFDQLNVLKSGDSTPDAGTGASGAVVGDPKEANSALDELKAKVEAFKNAVIEAFAPASAAFGKLKDQVEELGGKVWDGLQWAYENILKPIGEWGTKSALPAFLDLLAGGFNLLNSVLDALKPLGEWLWENFLKPIGEWTGGAIIDALKWLTDRLNDLSAWIDGHQELVQNIVLAVGTITAITLIGIGVFKTAAAIIGVVVGVTQTLGTVLAFIAANPVVLVVAAIVALIAIIVLLIYNWDAVKAKVEEVWGAIVTWWGPIGKWFEDNVTGPIGQKFGELGDTLGKAVNQIYERSIKPLAEFFTKYLWPLIQGALAGIGDNFNVLGQFIKGVFDTLIGNFKISFDGIISIFQNLLKMVGDVIAGVVDILKGLIQFITGVFTGDWKLAWEGVKNIFKGIFEALVGIVKGVLNTVIDLINGLLQSYAAGINAVIGGINNIRVDIPWWVPGYGGQSWGLSLPFVSAPQIPHLAQGAVIPANSEFLAVLGDQKSGRNLEAPESLIRQIIQEELGNIQAQIDINFSGSLAELIRILKPYLDKEQVRIGGNLIKGSGSVA